MGRLRFAVILAAAGIGGVLVGTMIAPSVPDPAVPIARVPSSTPDQRSPAPAPTPTTTPQSSTAMPTAAPTVAPTVAATPGAVRTPTATAVPRGRAVVYFARPAEEPVAVETADADGGTSESDHVFFRLNALRIKKTGGPEGSVNIVGAMAARLLEVTAEGRGLVTVGYSAPNDDWGVTPEQMKLVLQQIVFTATEEPTVDRVRLTQNGGKPAVIAGQLVEGEMTRESLR